MSARDKSRIDTKSLPVKPLWDITLRPSLGLKRSTYNFSPRIAPKAKTVHHRRHNRPFHPITTERTVRPSGTRNSLHNRPAENPLPSRITSRIPRHPRPSHHRVRFPIPSQDPQTKQPRAPNPRILPTRQNRPPEKSEKLWSGLRRT